MISFFSLCEITWIRFFYEAYPVSLDLTCLILSDGVSSKQKEILYFIIIMIIIMYGIIYAASVRDCR